MNGRSEKITYITVGPIMMYLFHSFLQIILRHEPKNNQDPNHKWNIPQETVRIGRLPLKTNWGIEYSDQADIFVFP